MENNSRIDDFYNDLVQSGFTFGGKTDRASYDAMMADDSRSKKLYGILTDRGWDLDDYDTWRNGFSSQSQPNSAIMAPQGGGENGNESKAEQLDGIKDPYQTAHTPQQVQQKMNTSRLDPKYQPNDDGNVKPYSLLEQEKTVDDNGNTQWKPKLVKGADGTDVYRNAMTGEEYNPLSPEGMENVGQNTMDPHQYATKTNEPSWGETLGKGLGAGFTRVGAQAVDLLQMYASGRAYKVGDKLMLTPSYEEMRNDKNNELTKASDMLHATADRMSQEAQPHGGKKGFIDLLLDGEIGTAAQMGLATAGESLPMTLSAFNPYTMVGNGILMAAGNYRDQTIENPDVPEWKRATYAVGKAAIEQAVEKYADPVFKYFGGNKEAVKKVTKEATESIAKRIYKALGGFAKDLSKDMGKEGTEEVVTNFGNDALGSVLDWMDGQDDYGYSAQFEALKKENPGADLWDFAKVKAKENVEAFLGGAISAAYTSGGAQGLVASAKGLSYAVNRDSKQEVPDGVKLDPVTVNVAQSFDDGYKFEIPQEKNDAKNMYDVQRERMAGIVDEDTLNDIENDPVSWIVANKGNLDADNLQTVLDYANAKATYDGMIQKVRDDIDSQCAAFDKLIDSRTNRAGANAGMLVPATMKMNDRQVFVIDGDIRMMDDGSMVDASKSSESILVCDAETGKVEFVSPHDVMNVGEAVNAEEEKARVREDTTRQIAQEQANQMEGVLPFNAGDEYALVDDKGEKHTVKVIANSADPTNPEVALVSWDGGALMPAPKEEIQKWSQQESRGRAEEKVAQKTAENATANGAEVNGEAVAQPAVEAVEQPVAPVTETAEGVQNTAENVINGGENVQQTGENVQPTAENVQAEPMPMIGEGDDAEPNFLATTPERGLSFLFGESQWEESDADDFLNSNVKASAKEVEKIEGKRPKAGTNFAKFNKDMAAWNASKQEAEAKAKYWKQMKELRDAELAKQKAERDAAEKARQEAATDQAIAEEAAYAAEQERLAAEQEERGANNVAPAIREKWNNAKKVKGLRDQITLPNGKVITGTHYMVEAMAITPSHDANNGFTPTVGFPVNETGENVNTRDYYRDKDAQTFTNNVSADFDERGMGVVVSKDAGIPYSGNGRTMAGQLAATNGTDGKYIGYLTKYGQKYGYTAEQVGEFEHPRDVFVPDEQLPYTSEVFDMFNQQEMKGQNKTEQAVKLGKVVDDATFGRIITSINRFERMSDFYADAKAATEAIGELQKAGAISQAQVAEMYDGDGISAIGRELLENMLVGKAFENNPDAVREITAFRSVRQTVIKALGEILNNVKLGEDYSLEEELAGAIDLVYKARKEGGYKEGERVSGFARQMNLGFFGEDMTVADMTNVTMLEIADILNSGFETRLKVYMQNYNTHAQESAAGQLDLFSGEVMSKEDILNDVNNLFNNGTEQETADTRAEGVAEDGAVNNGGTESESGLVGDYSLSDQTAANGEHFIQDADGNIDLVDIPQEVLDEIGYRKAPLRLTPSMLDHFISSHKKETKIDNREKAIEFILDVMNNFDHVRLGYDGALIFSVEDGRKTGKRAISVLISQASGDFYGIVSSGYEPVVRLQKRPLLWDGSAVITPTTDAASANVSTLDAQKSGEQSGSASNQSKSPNSEVNTLPAVGSSAITDTAGVAHGTTTGEAITNGNSPIDSQGKGSNNSATKQAQVDETDIFSQNEAETESTDGNTSPVAAAIAAAEAETDTNPSDAQKEAGNYKKGHVKVDGYDITIENPKGSVRSGKDADGKEWSVTMNNTYGYIRGTEGVDGDHIDVFLSDNPEQGNVYVVDQVDADGNFDEHKVMYGFGSAEEARDNYLANYSDGWKMGTITEVSKEEFKKWIESSHRKTKPFSEYKSVKKEGAQGEAQNQPSTAAAEKETNVDKAIRIMKEIDDLSSELDELYTTGPEAEADRVSAEHMAKYGELEALEKSMTDEEKEALDKRLRDEVDDLDGEWAEWLEAGMKEEPVESTHNLNNAEAEKNQKPEKPQKTSQRKPRKTKPSTTTAGDEKIEDVGEKIGGARKDATLNYAKKIDLEATVPSKIFPKPNFASMEKAGVPHETLVKLKAYYTAFSIINKNKRKRNENQRILSARFYASVARDMLLRDVDVFNESADGIVLTDYGKQHLELLVACVEALDKKGMQDFFDLDISDVDITIGEFKENENGAYQTKDGKRWVGTYSYGRTNNMAAVRYKLFALDDIEGLAEEYCKQVEEAHSKNVQNEIKIHVYRMSSGKCYISAKVKGIADEIKLKDGFASSKEAFDYIRENGDALRTEARAKADEMKQSKRNGGGTRKPSNDDIERMLRNIVHGTRIGKDYRNGKDVSAEDFMKEFGFRGVEFGNWATQKERQDHLNACYDALMDLADLVGISPKAVSLGGKLAMAFGSRGHSSALAHYEPAKHVINLTKEHGAGCVAHEWFHAIDNYFGGGVFSLRMKSAVEGNSRDNLRSEMQKILAEIGRALNSSDMKVRSKKLGNGNYWASTLEMAARAFESYVNERLMARGQMNQYLSAHVPVEAVEYDVLAKYDPYPTAEESKKFGEIFDRLFDTVQEEVADDGNVNLFQIADVEPGTDNVTEAQQLATEAIITALGENAGLDVVMESQEKGQSVAAEQNADTKMMALSNNEQEFDSMKKMAHDENGHVLPGLAEKTVTVVPLSEHGFAGTLVEAIKKAKEWAKSNLAGKEYDFPEGGKYVISNKAIGKYLSSSAFTKSDNSNVHLAALRMLPEIIGNSVDAEIHEDYKKGEDGKRNVNNGVENENKLVHRLYGAVTLGDKTYRVKTTMYEYRDSELKNNTPHSYEITEIELLDSPVLPAEAVKNTIGISNNSISGANLLKNVEKSYDNGVKILDNQQNTADNKEELKRSDGTVYGWSEGNRIHLTPKGINPNTPIHEYTHLWAMAVMQKNPKLWNRIKELLQGTPIWEEVVNDPAYQGLTSDDAIASEALSRLSGRKNAGKMEQMAQDLLNEAKGNGVLAEANAHTLILKMKQALKDFWKWVGTNLFDMTDVKNIDEVTDRVLYDMLNKTDLALSEDGDVATEFQVVTDDQVNTPQFKKWFGDWEKDPEHSSKVVDAEGKPLVVYHGTQLMEMYFNEGRPYTKYTERFNTFNDGKGFFTSDRDAAESFARGKQGLYETYLNIRNPYVIDCKGKDWDAIEGYENPEGYTTVSTDYIVNDIKRNHPEYDGVIFKNVMNENNGVVGYPIDDYVPFKASQIKSATENNGEFDAENADIRFRERTEFDDGEVIDIVGNRGSQDFSLADSTMPSYKTKEELLHAFQEKHPAYAAVLTADGNGIEVTAWKSVLDKNIRKPRRRNGEPTKAEKQRAAYVERKTQIAISNVNEKAQKLGLNVEVITDTEGLPKNMADKKGWYNKVTGKITIVLPNHSNGQDVMRTLMHEGVAHHGLRQMFGKDFDTFLDNVYANASEEVRKRIAEMAARKGWDFHVATEEYLAALAEDIDFERKVDQTWWQKVKFFFIDMLRKAGIVLDDKLTDNDLRYIVWKSYERMAYAGEYGAIRDARTVMMDQQLGTGNFGTRAVADGSQVADGSELLYRDAEAEAEDSAPLSLNESMIQGLINLAEKNKENAAYKTYVVKAIGGELAKLRKAMSAQKEYDRSTVEQLTGLARLLIKNGMFGNISEQEMLRLLTTIKNATGRNDITKYAQQIYDLMIKNQLEQARNMLDQVTRIKGSKVNAQGVEVQGQLDVRGQNLIKAFRKAMQLDEANINELLQNASDRMDSPDAAVADEAATEYAALTLAMQYVHDIKDSVADERVAKEELAQARKDHAAKTDGLSAKAYKEYVQEAEDAIRQKQLERIEAFHNLAARLAGAMQGSIESAKKFRERELERVKNIHHFANSDMQGRPANAHRVDNWKQKVMNNPFLRFLFNPLGTFDQMLRMIGNKSVNGEGYLYNHFMRGWLDATQKEFDNFHAACKVLDDKVSEVFGKKMRWSDLYAEERNMPKAEITFVDVDGSERTVELNQGNLLYIYMANKMADGRMKLRAMGIMEDDIENIKQVLDPRFVKLADWLQEEFLVNKRNDYNAVHERMFGAPMAAIENYFPLRILGDARVQQVDVAEDKIENELPSILTGSIIKRKTNKNPLDVMNTDAFSVVVEHLQQMEKWAAFAEWRRDLNTLLSYKRFRNQLKNMSSVYGAGNTLWRNFMIAGSIAAGTHRPKVDYDGVDTTLVNVAKGVTTAKIAFRVFTAIKQLLSAPAFMAESSLLNLGKSIATPWKSWNWAMEELPTFKKRWQSKQAGDSRLMKTDVDWRFWKNRLVDTLSRWGMSPNAFVDAMTVAIGGRAIYETKRARYIEDGYSEAEADKKAKQDAAVLVNQTQQSSETAFVSKMQLDRTVAAVSLSVFRNSSMSYQRQLVDAIRGLKRMATPGYKEESIDFMAKQMVRDGLDEDAAKRAAKRAYNREWVRNLSRTALFGFCMQMAWNLGAYLPYLIFGDDDDEKKEMLEDAAMHGLFGSIEGLSGGNMISELGNMKVKGESFRNYDMDLLPLMSDIKNIYTKFESDEVAAVNDMVNLLIQSGFGVNPQTITDAIVAITDACNGDVETGREATILFMRLAQAPQSQIDKLYLDELGMRGDEASKLSVQQLAERYADYKKKRGATLMQWAYSDDQEKAVEDKYIKKFEKQAKERLMQTTGDAKLDDAFEAYEENYKDVKKRLEAVNKLKDEDFTEFCTRMGELASTPEFKKYNTFKGYKTAIDNLMKSAINAKNADEREGYLKMIDDRKRTLVNTLDSIK